MPVRIEIPDSNAPVRQIVTSASENDFLEHLIESLKVSDHTDLVHSLSKISSERDADIEDICTNNHQEFVTSVTHLDQARQGCTNLGNDILSLVQSYQTSTDNLAAQKKNLVDSRNVRQNIDDSSEALKECLEVLRLSNQVHDLVAKQNHYAALRTLDELQATLQTRETVRYKIGDLIEKSVPATQKMIAEAVMSDLNTWLYHIRDVSQYIGEVAFFHTEQRRLRQKERMAKDEYLGSFKLNSAIELVADETEEYDVLNNEEAQVNVDFTPLFECLHIHDALGKVDTFRMEFASTRRRQKDLILPAVLKVDDEDCVELRTLLESITGFTIVENAITKRTNNFRASTDVEELWDAMCQSSATLISNATATIDNPDVLLRVTSVIALFIQTMQTWKFTSSSLTALLMNIYQKHVNVLRKRTAEDFTEIVDSDDYMPMPINNIEEYDKIIEVGWYVPDKERSEMVFPCVLPFSQMYPMCCIDIRNFLSQVYSGPDDYLQRSSAVDDAIRDSLDQMLCQNVCKPLVGLLNSQYPGQIVQIMTNFEYFQQMSLHLQKDLTEARSSRPKGGPVVLQATADFESGKLTAEKRIFTLVNSKIDDLVETSEYDWSATRKNEAPSNYMTELTAYLSNIMGSVLLGLPDQMKEIIYLDALIHASSNILALPLDRSVTSISPAALHTLNLDVKHLDSYISTIALPEAEQTSDTNATLSTARPFSMAFALASTSPANGSNISAATAARATTLQKTLQELTQTLTLMSAPDPLEFYDISQRNKKYNAVNPQNGAELLEKVEKGREGMESRQQKPQGAMAAAIATASGARNSNEYNGERSMTPTGLSMEAKLKAGSDRLFGSMRGLSKRGQDGAA